MTGAVLRRLSLRALVALLCLGLLAPILVVVVASFSGEGYLRFPPESLSVRWYDRFLGDPRWRGAILNSLVIGAMTCVAATALGFLAAYAMVRGGFRGKGAVTAFLLAPLVVPHVVTAVAAYFLSARLGSG